MTVSYQALAGIRSETTMDVKAVMMSLLRGSSGRMGLWDFLSRYAEGKVRLGLEQARNRGTHEAIRLLPHGGVLREGGQGWVREVWMPGTPVATVGRDLDGSDAKLTGQCMPLQLGSPLNCLDEAASGELS